MPERDAMSQSDGTMESSMPERSQRVSALYQYSNAPEVAPAHGLEYDDSNYPVSDKYPVVHSTANYDTQWQNKGYAATEEKPPRIIFGMKTRTFLIVAAIMIMVIVGAAVGGAVGGSTIKSNNPMATMAPNSTSNANTTSSTATPTATPSLYTAAVPTYAPVNDCPAANNTLYSSSFLSGQAGSVQSGSQLNFTRYCNVNNPIDTANTLISTFVYSFEDCIEVCASLNFHNANGNCRVAAFNLTGERPANCWAGAVNVTLNDLSNSTSVDVAFILQ